MGRIKPKTVSDLMDIANRFADGEDACNNKRTRSPEDDRGNRYGGQCRRSRNYNNYGSHSQVAAGYKDHSYQSNDRKNSGYRSYDKEDYKKDSAKGVQRVQPITRRYAQRTMSYSLCVCRREMNIQTRNERLHYVPEIAGSSTQQASRGKTARI
jgi:hypothetical protein